MFLRSIVLPLAVVILANSDVHAKRLLVANAGSDQVLSLSAANGDLIDVLVEGGEAVPEALENPVGILVDPNGDLLVSSARGANAILRYDGVSGEFIDVFASSPELDTPLFMTFGPDENLYVSSAGSGEILRYDGFSGEFIDVFASNEELSDPIDLMFGHDGNLFVSDQNSNSILRFNGENGEFIDRFVTDSILNAPAGFIFAPAVPEPLTICLILWNALFLCGTRLLCINRTC